MYAEKVHCMHKRLEIDMCSVVPSNLCGIFMYTHIWERAFGEFEMRDRYENTLYLIYSFIHILVYSRVLEKLLQTTHVTIIYEIYREIFFRDPTIFMALNGRLSRKKKW